MPTIKVSGSRLGNIKAFSRIAGQLKLVPPVSPEQDVHRHRRLLADFVHVLSTHVSGREHPSLETRSLSSVKKDPPGPQEPRNPAITGFSPRIRQTLERLLAGDSEKQIASRLGISPHTIHCYVKKLYRDFNVCSRGELLARFVNVG